MASRKKIEPDVPLVLEQAPVERPKRASFRDQMSRITRPVKRNNIFKPAEPFPGVIPEGVSIAMDYDDGLGAMADFAFANSYGEGLGFMGYPVLAELMQRPEYRRFSEVIAEEMTRKFIRIVSASDESQDVRIKLINDALDKYDLRGILRRIAEVDGGFGRANLYPDLGPMSDEELKSPLIISKETVGLHQLKGFKVIEPFWTYPARYDARDPTRDDFYKPRAWYVMGREYHWTRMIPFVGREVPDILKPAYSFGGLSLTQMVKPYVDNWIRTRQNVSDAIEQFAQSILMTDLESTLAGGAGDDLDSRVALYNAVRSARGLMVIDKDREGFEIASMPLGTLDKLQAQAQEQMCSVVAIPLVKYLGITPSGLNASADGEIRVFFDTIAGNQVRLFGRHMKFILDLIMQSELGEVNKDISYSFEALWQMSETERATYHKTNADTSKAYIDMGVVSPEEVRGRLAGEEDGMFQGLDPDDLPEPPQQPSMFDPNDPDADPNADPSAGSGPGGGDPPGGQPKPAAKPTVVAQDEFKEEDHPRAGDGRFGRTNAIRKGLSPANSAFHKIDPDYIAAKHNLIDATAYASDPRAALSEVKAGIPAKAKFAGLHRYIDELAAAHGSGSSEPKPAAPEPKPAAPEPKPAAPEPKPAGSNLSASDMGVHINSVSDTKSQEATAVMNNIVSRFPGARDFFRGKQIDILAGKTLRGGSAYGNYSTGDIATSEKVEIPSGLSSEDGPLQPGKFTVAKTSFPGVLRHELAHSIQKKIESKSYVNVKALFNQSDKSQISKSISQYAAESPEEWFAESLSAYMHPDFSKSGIQINPKLKNAFDKVLVPSVPVSPAAPKVSSDEDPFFDIDLTPALDAEFNEDDHPRGKGGKFSRVAMSGYKGEKAEVKPGSDLYHSTNAKFDKFHNATTWFTPFKGEAKAIANNFDSWKKAVDGGASPYEALMMHLPASASGAIMKMAHKDETFSDLYKRLTSNIAQDAEWEEHKHPRGPGGKFASSASTELKDALHPDKYSSTVTKKQLSSLHEQVDLAHELEGDAKKTALKTLRKVIPSRYGSKVHKYLDQLIKDHGAENHEHDASVTLKTLTSWLKDQKDKGATVPKEVEKVVEEETKKAEEGPKSSTLEAIEAFQKNIESGMAPHDAYQELDDHHQKQLLSDGLAMAELAKKSGAEEVFKNFGNSAHHAALAAQEKTAEQKAAEEAPTKNNSKDFEPSLDPDAIPGVMADYHGLIESGDSPDEAMKSFLPATQAAIKKELEKTKTKADNMEQKNESELFGSQTKLPTSLDGLKKTGDKLGSNPGGTYVNEAGEKFYVKHSKSDDHARNEVLAGKLYEAAGAPVVAPSLIDLGGGKLGTITKWQDHDGKYDPDSIAHKIEVQQHFATHAWTGNWDAIGLSHDNQVKIGGKFHTVDVGGALKYRAQGEAKKEADFDHNVKELDTLLDPAVNPNTAKAFKGIGDDALKNSAAKLPSDAEIKKIVDSVYKDPDESNTLSQKLIARKNDIQKKAGVTTPKPDPAPALATKKIELSEGSKALKHVLNMNLPNILEKNKPAVQEMINSIDAALASDNPIEAIKNVKPIADPHGQGQKAANNYLAKVMEDHGHAPSKPPSSPPPPPPPGVALTPKQEEYAAKLKAAPPVVHDRVSHATDAKGQAIKAVLKASTADIPGDWYAAVTAKLEGNHDHDDHYDYTSGPAPVVKKLDPILEQYCNQVSHGPLSQEHKNVLSGYQDSKCYAMNAAMNEAPPMPSKTSEMGKEIAAIKEAINKSPIPAKLPVWRGIGADFEKITGFKNPQDAVGKGFVHTSFASVSRKKSTSVNFSNGKTLLKFTLPAGTKGVFMPGQNGSEREIVLDSHSMFRIDKVETGAEAQAHGVKHLVHVTYLGRQEGT